MPRDSDSKKVKVEHPASIANGFNVTEFSDEILLKKFSYLTVKDLCSVSRVNKRFNKLANDKSLWQPMINHYTKGSAKQEFFAIQKAAKTVAQNVIALVTQIQMNIDKQIYICPDGEERDYCEMQSHLYCEKFNQVLAGFDPLSIVQEIINIASISNVNSQQFLNRKGAMGQTLLHFFATTGNKSAVELLLLNGADINTKDDWGYTPVLRMFRLDERMQAPSTEMLRLLMDYKADFTVTIEENKGITDFIYSWVEDGITEYETSLKILAFLVVNNALSEDNAGCLLDKLAEEEITENEYKIFDKYMLEFRSNIEVNLSTKLGAYLA